MESCLKKKNDKNFLGNSGNPTKVGISDPSLSGSFLKTRALLKPHGAGGQGDSQRHHKSQPDSPDDCGNSVFPTQPFKSKFILEDKLLEGKNGFFSSLPFVLLGTV